MRRTINMLKLTRCERGRAGDEQRVDGPVGVGVPVSDCSIAEIERREIVPFLARGSDEVATDVEPPAIRLDCLDRRLVRIDRADQPGIPRLERTRLQIE